MKRLKAIMEKIPPEIMQDKEFTEEMKKTAKLVDSFIKGFIGINKNDLDKEIYLLFPLMLAYTKVYGVDGWKKLLEQFDY